jgi:putative FmdB family regulatory protein
MPVYEYVCEYCETRFEELRPVSRMDSPAKCAEGHRARRVLSNFSAMTKDGFGESEPVGGGSGCGGCAGGCTCGAD